MQPIHSLHDFFLRSGAEIRLYHLGRRVEPCSLDTLAAFETGELAWPAPWQGTARLAMVFRLGDLEDPLIWFLALPLDEQVRLASGALEGSNVSAVEAMVSMIDVARRYEMQMKTISTADENAQRANSLLQVQG